MRLVVPHLDTPRVQAREASRLLDPLPATPIAARPWTAFPYAPQVSFVLAYGRDALYIRYTVHEREVLALYQHPNQPVCNDSCVEVFISPASDRYYNFEFNCIGTCYAAVGTDRMHRRMIPPARLEALDTHSTLGSQPFDLRMGAVSWELTAVIPYALMDDPAFAPARGDVYRANFYKCGDAMTTPHYVTWSPVGTPEPDYHQPKYFGEIEFG